MWIKITCQLQGVEEKEGFGFFPHGSSLLDRAAGVLDTLISSPFIFLCAWDTLLHLKQGFKSVFAKLLQNPVWMLFSWFDLGLCWFSFLPTFAKSIWGRVKSTYECPCNLIKSTDVANVTDCN